MVTWSGDAPTGIVAITVLVVVLMTDTVLLPLFTMYTSVPSGVIAVPTGPVPTGMVATTVLVVVLITDTELLFSFVT